MEAFAEMCAREAIIGLRGVYISTFTKVAVQEMTSVLNVKSDKKPLKAGQWCRLRRGPLKGDLCKIIDVYEGGSKAFIMAVPRPDFTVVKKVVGAKAPRPPPRLFDPKEAQQVWYRGIGV